MVLWGVSSVLIMWGFYRVGKGNRERSAEQAADRELRYMMAPVLQAESDRWYVAREMEIRQQEAEIMKDVPGFKPGESVYLTKRWVPRQFTEMDTNYKK
jgi:NADH dehydrogenase (ubiquinone) 1 alpha subcomplex subunit 13